MAGNIASLRDAMANLMTKGKMSSKKRPVTRAKLKLASKSAKPAKLNDADDGC